MFTKKRIISLSLLILTLVILYKDKIGKDLTVMIILSIIFFYAMSLLEATSKEKVEAKQGVGVIKSEGESFQIKTTFKDVAGHKDVKKDLAFLINFMKNPEKYSEMGARMPKGVIFYGSPGNGKTLLAKAIAGESGVNFIAASGSDFLEMYVGVGARRVRDLFSKAKKNAPCIVFIDEIDAVGGKRGNGNNSEKDQTINQLLVELDGFNSSDDGVVVIAATNRLDMLDSALLRPGRFDRHIAIPMPDYSDRLELLQLHSRNKRIDENLSLENLAKTTIGFSGADLENLLNEAAIIAVNEGKESITMDEIDEAQFKILMKGYKKRNDKTDESLRIVAYHEAGHALCTKLITEKSVPKVTCIGSTSGAGGVTFITPNKMGLHTKEDLKNEIKISYAGRIAEYLLTKNMEKITTGASQDITQATNNIIMMINDFGMSDEVGMLNLSAFRNSGEKEILEESKILSKELYSETLELLSKNFHLLEKIAEELIIKETLLEEDLDRIIKESNIGTKEPWS